MFVSSTFHNSNNKRFSVSIKKTFEKIKHVSDLRQSLSPGSKEKFTDVCHNIPEKFELNQGYHRQCYSKFTNRVKQLTSGDDKTQETQRMTIRTRQHFLSNECVFCQKEGPRCLKRNGVWVMEYLHSLSFGVENILQQAQQKNDDCLIQRINGYGDITDYIRLHKSCRSDYMQKSEKWRKEKLRVSD